MRGACFAFKAKDVFKVEELCSKSPFGCNLELSNKFTPHLLCLMYVAIAVDEVGTEDIRMFLRECDAPLDTER